MIERMSLHFLQIDQITDCFWDFPTKFIELCASVSLPVRQAEKLAGFFVQILEVGEFADSSRDLPFQFISAQSSTNRSDPNSDIPSFIRMMQSIYELFLTDALDGPNC